MKQIFTIIVTIALGLGWWLIPIHLYSITGSPLMVPIGFALVVLIMAGLIQGLKEW